MQKRFIVLGVCSLLVIVLAGGAFTLYAPQVFSRVGQQPGGTATTVVKNGATCAQADAKNEGKKCSSYEQVQLAKRKPATPTATPKPKPTATPTPQPVQTNPTPVATTPPTGGNGGVATGGNQEAQLAQQLLALINQDRANAGLPALTWNGTIATVAYAHSQNMAGYQQMSHQLSNEPSPCDRVRNGGVNWNTCGENVGMSSAGADKWTPVKGLHQLMMAEQPPNDGHRRNLLSSSFHQIGIGIHIDANGKVWLTEDFTN